MAARAIKPPEQKPAPAWLQCAGAILWPSFFVAGVVTMVFFAYVDPVALRDITFPSLKLGRELGYSLGFFLIWLATLSSSLFTWILLRPGRSARCGSSLTSKAP
ncbi:hypothetical protein [Dyella sedimenti]|uniref:hypothetical protein n=1 Tax=Dyella sedimenti TaxID=2919947 RepID=UPI001FAA611E|nr:hypothetical protein [Dyella sedimenti]